MHNGTDYYAMLGLTTDATLEEIKSAYRQAARRYHPDVNSQPGETELFLDIKKAYDVLSDPRARAEYDTKIDSKAHVSPASIKVLYSRSSLPLMEEPQLVYALMQLSPAAKMVAAATPPINVCLVIDRSSSMGGERMDKVKDTAIELLRNLRSTDTISIVTFNDYAEVLLPAGKSVIPNVTETAIRLLQTNGGTEIFKGLEAGFNEVRSNMRSTSIDHIILITDGRTYGDEQACLNLADFAGELGIGISGLGIGGEWNDSFLDDMATRTGGSSVYVSEPADIEKFLKQKFHNLSQSFAERVVYNAEINPEVELNYAFRLNPESNVLSAQPPLKLGRLPKESNLEVLLEFLVPPIVLSTDHVLLAQGRFSLDIPFKPMPLSTRQLTLSLPIAESSEADRPPAELLRAMKQLTLYRIQEKAQQDVAAGELNRASRRLQHLATHLLSQGEHDLARTVLEEAKNLADNHSLSGAGSKEIKYGTRALVMPGNSFNDER